MVAWRDDTFTIIQREAINVNQPSLRDDPNRGVIDPGVETPGYHQSSLRDNQARNDHIVGVERRDTINRCSATAATITWWALKLRNTVDCRCATARAAINRILIVSG
jgi:hypothetical protein